MVFDERSRSGYKDPKKWQHEVASHDTNSNISISSDLICFQNANST